MGDFADQVETMMDKYEFELTYKQERKMAREIPGAVQTDRYPMVGLRKIGNYVKGKVTALGATSSKNPFVTMTLIDLNGSTSISPAKGVYEEVDVDAGDLVQLIGTVTDLKDKLPKLQIGDVITVTQIGRAHV